MSKSNSITDSNKMVKVLDSLYDKALNGIPMVSDSVDQMAEDYISPCLINTS